MLLYLSYVMCVNYIGNCCFIMICCVIGNIVIGLYLKYHNCAIFWWVM